MTIYEVSEQYSIPLEILRAYESWRLCGMEAKTAGVWQYTHADLERLSLILTLRDIGFENEEIKDYMKLLLEQDNTEARRLKMLEERRRSILEEVHNREQQLEQLDYLRYHIREHGAKIPGSFLSDKKAPEKKLL